MNLGLWLLAGALLAPSGGGLPGTAGPSLTILRPGAPVEKIFRSSSDHRYGVLLEPGQYARVLVQEMGGDLSVIATSPTGSQVLEADSPTDRCSLEVVSLLGEPAGLYTLEVKPQGVVEAEVGGYRIWLEALRPATSEDRLRLEAEWANAKAFGLSSLSRPGDLDQVLSGYRHALDLWKRLGDVAEEASSYYRMGLAYFSANRPADALPLYERSLEIWRRLGNEVQTSKALHQLARTRQVLGDRPGALAAYRESIDLAKAAGAVDMEAVTLNNLARFEVALGDLPSALDAFERSLALYKGRGDDSGVALILQGLGNVYDLQGKPTEAADAFERSLALLSRLKLGNLPGNALNSLGNLYQRLGQPYRALQYFLPALDRYGEAHNPQSQGLVMVNLGSLLVELGEPGEGETMLLKALPLLRDPRDQAQAQLLLSRIAQERGDAADALRLAEQAVATQHRMENPAGEASALSALGFLQLDRGEPRPARDLFTRALDLFKATDSLVGQARALRGLGRTATELGEAAATKGQLEQALSLARELGDTLEEARVWEETARSHQLQGNLGAARTDLEQAIQRLESLRSGIAGDQFRASAFAAHRRTYETYVDVLARLQPAGVPAGLAFEAAEKARARGLLDFLGQARVDLREGAPDVLREEQRLRLEISAKAGLRTALLHKPARAAELAELDRELTSLSTQYQIVEARLAANSPAYARLQQPEVRLEEIQKVLDADTVVLEYFLAEPRSYLWLVTPESLATFTLPGRGRIEELARRVHERLGHLDTQPEAGERQALEELSRLLLGPVAGHLQGKRLAIVPDGTLLYIPFAALPEPAADGKVGAPLVAAHEIVHLPSAAAVREIRQAREGRPRPAAELALLADPVFETTDPRLHVALASAAPTPGDKTRGAGSPPPLSTRDLWSDFLGLPRQGDSGNPFARLPWTRREAEAIASEAGGRDVLLALDFKANRALATAEELGRYRLLHFATHGVLDTQHPALSGLVLSQVDEQGRPQDGFLRLHDVYHLRLNADLVVLSGCETALGRTLQGEGIMGLTRGFFHAGASQVLASLWPVRDRATAELMQRFYRAMLKDGLPASAALRQAQLSLAKERAWRDPYFWAGFVLQGDWQAGAQPQTVPGQSSVLDSSVDDHRSQASGSTSGTPARTRSKASRLPSRASAPR